MRRHDESSTRARWGLLPLWAWLATASGCVGSGATVESAPESPLVGKVAIGWECSTSTSRATWIAPVVGSLSRFDPLYLIAAPHPSILVSSLEAIESDPAKDTAARADSAGRGLVSELSLETGQTLTTLDCGVLGPGIECHSFGLGASGRGGVAAHGEADRLYCIGTPFGHGGTIAVVTRTKSGLEVPETWSGPPGSMLGFAVATGSSASAPGGVLIFAGGPATTGHDDQGGIVQAYALGSEEPRFTVRRSRGFGMRLGVAGDLDEDGEDDVVASGDDVFDTSRCAALSGRTGELLWEAIFEGVSPTACLASGGDVDGDGTSDVLAGQPSREGGRVVVLSGRSGKVLREYVAPAGITFFGSAIAMASRASRAAEGVLAVVYGGEHAQVGPPTQVRRSGIALISIADGAPHGRIEVTDSRLRLGAGVALLPAYDGCGYILLVTLEQLSGKASGGDDHLLRYDLRL